MLWMMQKSKKSASGFTPISVPDYVKLHLTSNPGEREVEVTAQLKRALRDYQAGIRCSCGEPIWVIGASQVGNMCFTCITGEAWPDDDYEIGVVSPNPGSFTTPLISVCGVHIWNPLHIDGTGTTPACIYNSRHRITFRGVHWQ